MTDLVENGSSEVEKCANEGPEGIAKEQDWKALYEKLEQDLQKRTTENEILKSRIACLEKEQNNPSEASKSNKNEKQNDDMLTKAKELLFERTKICKRQEQQIEALKIQIDSLKEVLQVSKDMLEIRNMENKHFQEQFTALDGRLKSEREHHVITEKKLILSKRMYGDLRKEHDLQSSIFKELQETYKSKIKVLTTQIEQLKKKDTEENQTNGN
ncbi:uncharacterized protein LOC129787394 [Lutzomyia longipalpis]|uniref:Uncharacterized protein n=1 Tax=Lutzomyia longipalpis TaxID=7200 RepID=A0A7G3AM52_LUTLO|nr:uncharacterized protein LOC129787394 [Lutzomyia longipalpis]